MILLYGYGIGNKSIEKYLIKNSIVYDIYEDNQHWNKDISKYSLIIKSSGIPLDTDLIKLSKQFNIPIITDLEMFYKIVQNKHIIAITGSNGKTTTTSLLGYLLDCNYEVCGNIGIPLFDKIDSNKNYIIETSSYMLECISTFKPNIFVLLNIEKHHLEHHKTFINYIKAKIKPLKNMNNNDIIIYNYDDIIIRRIVDTYSLKKYSFSLNNRNVDCFYENHYINLQDEYQFDTNNLNLFGRHNIMNVMASLLVLKSLNINDLNKYFQKINTFKPLPHRLELFLSNKYPSTIFINDSKSTNYYSTKVAITSVKNKYKTNDIILLLGGKKEELSKEQIISLSNDVYRTLVFGEISNLIQDEYIKFSDLLSLCNYLKKIDIKNKIILFSPGEPSFDEFKSFEERGNYFKYQFR